MMTVLDRIDALQPWVRGRQSCSVCEKDARWYVAGALEKPVCMDCFLTQLETQLVRTDISHWSWERFSVSLSALGSVRDRLLGLIHFGRFQTVERMPELLVENLGFDSEHPLALFVRQKALEACSYFADSQKIVKTILGVKKFVSWQQKSNMVKVCYGINSSDPKIIGFIEKMADDPSPNVRNHVAGILLKNNKNWAKALCMKLRRDKNPLVREAFDVNRYDREITLNAITDKILARQAQTLKKNRVLEKRGPFYNQTEMAIKGYCDLSLHKKIYALYLSHIPDLLDKKKYRPGKYTPKEPAALKTDTEDACIRLLAAAVSNEPLFKTVLEKLPKEVVTLLYILARECEHCDSRSAERKIAQLMEPESPRDAKHGKKKKMPLHKAVKKDPAYFMFRAERDYTQYHSDTYILSIYHPFRASIKKCLSPPEFAVLHPVAGIKGRVEHIHDAHQETFRQLPAILSFIAQGNLKFAKNGNRVLKGSLKKMAAACGIEEFYAGGDNKLDYLKTQLLADFFCCMSPWKAKDLDDPAVFFKEKINQYFSFENFMPHGSRAFFDHVKRQMREFDSVDDEKIMRENFQKTLVRLVENEWVATRDLAIKVFYDGIELSPFSNHYEFSNLYINTNSRRYGRVDKEYLHNLSILDVLTLPYIRGMMFLMGALGVVDLGYSAPKNSILQQYDKPWFTVYDGLKYVRLSEFGHYLLDKKKVFTQEIRIDSAEIEIDEQKTMLSMFGKDPVRQMVLEAVGQKITGSGYLVNYESFLKDCSTRRDVENKIQFFRDNIAAEPPLIWETFFKQVLARMNPLEQVPAMSVFKVKPDRELLALLTRDSILKKYVIRAEAHHMIVKTSDFSKVKKRLALFGFFIS